MLSLVGQQSSCPNHSLWCMSRSIPTILSVGSCKIIFWNWIQLYMPFNNTQTLLHRHTGSWTRPVCRQYTYYCVLSMVIHITFTVYATDVGFFVREAHMFNLIVRVLVFQWICFFVFRAGSSVCVWIWMTSTWSWFLRRRDAEWRAWSLLMSMRLAVEMCMHFLVLWCCGCFLFYTFIKSLQS